VQRVRIRKQPVWEIVHYHSANRPGQFPERGRNDIPAIHRIGGRARGFDDVRRHSGD
jgi:hypothetical protein